MDPHQFEKSKVEPFPKHTLEIFPDFIWIHYSDELNGTNAKKAIDLIMHLSATHNIHRFISDSRGCPINYPVLERYEAGKYWAEKITPNIIAASIVDESQRSGIVENVAVNRGGTNLLITTDEAKAMEWIKTR